MANLKLQHALDASWLMALYLAIYGGDPPFEQTVSAEEAAAVAAKIIATLRPVAEAVSADRIAAVKLPVKSEKEVIASLHRLGIQGHTHQDGKRVMLAKLPTLTPHPPTPICWCIGTGELHICYCFRRDPEPSL
jgi:hypothetical protein